MSRNVLISVLGTGRYEEVNYKLDNESYRSRFVQESLARMLKKELNAGNDKNDESTEKKLCFNILLTKSAREKHWDKKEDEKSGEKSLKTIMEDVGVKIEEFNITDGGNDSEIWENFEIFLSALEQDDNVYIDITHSFRSIPIVLLSVLNYAKITKNIKLKKIYYGTFKSKEDEYQPIIDLTISDAINEWSNSISFFSKTGFYEDINKKNNTLKLDLRKKRTEYIESLEISKEEPKTKKNKNKIIKELYKNSDDVICFVDLFNYLNCELASFSHALKKGEFVTTCKTAVIIKETLKKLNQYKDIDKKIKLGGIKPMLKSLTLLDQKFSSFDIEKTIVENGLILVEICRDFELLQLAYTFLRENITTYMLDLNISNKKEVLNNKFKIKGNLKNENELDLDVDQNYVECIFDKDKRMEAEVEFRNYDNDAIESLNKLLRNIQMQRNKLNHANFNKQGKDEFLSSSKNRNNKKIEFLTKSIQSFKDIKEDLDKLQLNKDKSNINKKMVLVFSHEISEEQKIDAQNEFEINEFECLDKKHQEKWSNVDPEKDIEDVVNSIFEYIQKKYTTNDIILVQGEFGVTYSLVTKLKRENYTCVYATTKRISEEKIINGQLTKTSKFKHIQFRKYK